MSITIDNYLLSIVMDTCVEIDDSEPLEGGNRRPPADGTLKTARAGGGVP
jgi:hypothetical protein